MKKLLVLFLAAALCLSLCACDLGMLMDQFSPKEDDPQEIVGSFDQAVTPEGPNEWEGELDWMEGQPLEKITIDELRQMQEDGVVFQIVMVNDVLYANGMELDLEGLELDEDMLRDLLEQQESEQTPEEPREHVYLPIGTSIAKDEFVEAEGGLLYAKQGDAYWVIFPDETMASVSFATEEHTETSRDQAALISVYTYLPGHGMTILRHEEYRASDMLKILCTEYQHQEFDGVMCYVSSETTEYSEFYEGFITNKREYDPVLGMYCPTKIYCFDTEGKPDGHYENEYYPNCMTKETKGYYPDGTLSYIMGYNESGIMTYHTMYLEDGFLESEHTYDENGAPLLSTYYNKDGSYRTVESLEGFDRYTSYDANGKVTSTRDVPNS